MGPLLIATDFHFADHDHDHDHDKALRPSAAEDADLYLNTDLERPGR